MLVWEMMKDGRVLCKVNYNYGHLVMKQDKIN